MDSIKSLCKNSTNIVVDELLFKDASTEINKNLKNVKEISLTAANYLANYEKDKNEAFQLPITAILLKASKDEDNKQYEERAYRLLEGINGIDELSAYCALCLSSYVNVYHYNEDSDIALNLSYKDVKDTVLLANYINEYLVKYNDLKTIYCFVKPDNEIRKSTLLHVNNDNIIMVNSLSNKQLAIKEILLNYVLGLSQNEFNNIKNLIIFDPILNIETVCKTNELNDELLNSFKSLITK